MGHDVGCGMPQHLTALERANRVRLARAELKRRVGADELAAVDVIADPPPEAENMAIMDLLVAQHRWGRERARRALQVAGGTVPIPEGKTLAALTTRQRQRLAEELAYRRTTAPRAVRPVAASVAA